MELYQGCVDEQIWQSVFCLGLIQLPRWRRSSWRICHSSIQLLSGSPGNSLPRPICYVNISGYLEICNVAFCNSVGGLKYSICQYKRDYVHMIIIMYYIIYRMIALICTVIPQARFSLTSKTAGVHHYNEYLQWHYSDEIHITLNDDFIMDIFYMADCRRAPCRPDNSLPDIRLVITI